MRKGFNRWPNEGRWPDKESGGPCHVLTKECSAVGTIVAATLLGRKLIFITCYTKAGLIPLERAQPHASS